MERGCGLAVWSGIRAIELDARGDMKSAAKHDGFAGCQYRHLVEQAPCLHRNDATEVVDIIGILQPVTDEVGALADDRLADFAGSLAGNNQRQAEFATFLGNALICQASLRVSG